MTVPRLGSGHFIHDFRWLRFVKPDDTADYQSIQSFIQARKATDPAFDWPAFAARMDEMNDKNSNGSRTGDIVFIMNGPEGYQTVNQGDALNGWHGGPEPAESYVVMMLNIPGDVVDKQFIRSAVPNGVLRNWQLSSILKGVAANVKE